jgi:DEAD/DEAH box helicase domain-containing protein
VSLRRIGWDNFVIIDLDTDLTLAELDWHSTPTMLHEQAIYQHDGVQYQVERLDYDNHKAYVRRVEPDYFTTALTNVKVRVLEDEAEAPVVVGGDGDASPRPLEKAHTPIAGWGDVSIIEKVVGYKKVKFHTHENAGYGDVRLPDMEMHTTSFWLTVPAAACEAVGRVEAVEGLRGVANALELVATLALMCDPHDIGRTISDDGFGESHATAHPAASCAVFEEFSATAYLYDNVPGGVGLAERIYERAAELLARSSTLVMSCPCTLGCPSCVGATAIAATPHPASVSFDRKRATLTLLRYLRLIPTASTALDVA